MSEDGAPKTVAASERTLTILEALKELNGARISELSNHLEIAKSSVYSHLVTLQNHEYIVKEGNIYKLSFRFFRLGEYVRNQSPIYQAAKPKVDKLADITGEVASLMVEDHGMGTFIYRQKGSELSRPTTVGTRVYLHTTAGGKAILAFLPEKEVERILDKRDLPQETENTITKREQLFKELAEIRDCGVAFNDQEDIDGLRAIAAPVMSADNYLPWSISVYGPAHRLKGDLFQEEIPDLLLELTNDIQLNIAFSERDL